MSASNYYSHPFVSNSTLSQLEQELSTRDAFDSKNAFRLGTLQDNFITERANIDFLNKRIGEYSYTPEEWQWARKCKKLWDENPVTQALTKGATFQKEYYVEKVQFEHNGMRFPLDCRCKFDGFLDFAGWGWDLKSTKPGASRADCLKSIETFNYDRAAYFYMKLSGSNRMPYIFITKDYRNPQMHVFFINRDDAIWNRGREKCNELAFKYWMLKA